MKYSRIASYKTYEQMSERFQELELSIPFEKEVKSGSDSPLQQPIAWKNQQIGNRFCILPISFAMATKSPITASDEFLGRAFD